MTARRDPETLDAFRGALDYDLELRRVLTDAISRSGHSRDFIAAVMSEATATKVTRAMLDAWTAESRTKWNIPIKYAAAFDAAVGRPAVLTFLAKKAGCRVLGADETIEVELGRIAMERAALDRRETAVLSRLGHPSGGH